MRSVRNYVVVACTVLSCCASAAAQQKILWEGSVIPEQINVYESPATSARATKTLRQGDPVDVVLQIDTGDAWCRIAFAAASEPLGYVLCFNLERGGSARSQIAPTRPTAAQSHLATIAAPSITSTATAAPSRVTSDSAGLTNSDVLDMYKSGLPQDVLVAKIKSSHCNFDTSPSQLKQLKATGLGGAVILAMVEVPTTHAPTSDAEEIKQTDPKQAVIKDGKHRLFVTDDPLVEHYAFSNGSSVAAANSHSAAAASSQTGFESNPNGKADPRTVEIQADLWKFCPALTVTSNIQNADYILLFRRNDHHRTKMFLLGGIYGLAFSAHQKVDGASVFTATGDMIYSTKESTVDKTLKDVCSNVKW